MRAFVLTLTAGVTCALMLACGGATNENTTTTTNTKTTTTTTNTTTTTATPVVATTTESMGDKIGVPECDEYIAKYEACIKGKVPEAARAAMQSSFDTARKSWKDMAATTQGKAGLATACKTATDAAKQSMKAYGCDF